MNIVIKPLSLELNDIYLDFFDNRAFSDGNPMGPCYCNAAIMSSEELDKMVSEFGNDCKGTLRRCAVKQLEDERIFGYLAVDIDTNVAVGWCNSGDMKRYPINTHNAIPDFVRENACDNTFSIICFTIAPEYRGKGIATQLLEYVISDTKSKGFSIIEGYVNKKYEGQYWDHTGPYRLYEKFGFVSVMNQDQKIVMRKMIK